MLVTKVWLEPEITDFETVACNMISFERTQAILKHTSGYHLLSCPTHNGWTKISNVACISSWLQCHYYRIKCHSIEHSLPRLKGYCRLVNDYLRSVSDYSLQLKYKSSFSSLAKELLVMQFQKDECPISNFLRTLKLGQLFLITLVILILFAI